MVDKKHNCREHSKTKHATIKRPYHFVESGLPNVYLIGIDYRACDACQTQSAEIPALEDLMTKIARAVVQKEGPLTGAEIRFLRKRLRKKASDFAKTIGVSPEQVSRWENDGNPPAESADKLIRVYYSLLSEDPALQEKVNAHINEWLSTLPGEDHTASFRAELHENKWDAEPIAETATA
jgi:putative zinc finger/helix-turn-helix YgiT family protein